MHSFNPFRDLALWCGQFAPNADLVTAYQLMGLVVSLFAFFITATLVGVCAQRVVAAIQQRNKAKRKWYHYD